MYTYSEATDAPIKIALAFYVPYIFLANLILICSYDWYHLNWNWLKLKLPWSFMYLNLMPYLLRGGKLKLNFWFWTICSKTEVQVKMVMYIPYPTRYMPACTETRVECVQIVVAFSSHTHGCHVPFCHWEGRGMAVSPGRSKAAHHCPARYHTCQDM